MDELKRPAIYLDQNILDLLVKAKSDTLQKLICNHGHIIYSDETLAEIYRCGSYAPKFLDLLVKLKARYLQLITDDKGRQVGLSAQVIDVSIVEKYQEFEQRELNSNNDSQHISDMMFKMFGGLSDESFSDIAIRQFADLKETLLEIEIDSDSSTAEIEMAAMARSILDGASDDFAHALPDNDEQLQVTAMRESLGIGPKELNNIVGPNVIEKIFAKAQETSPHEVIDIASMMSIKEDPAEPGRELLPQEKVRNIYMFLNLIGFFPDTKMNKERGFRRASSDVEHACVAPFANILLSGDYAFVRKCAAAFEYLEIPTGIMHFDINTKAGTVRVENYAPENKFTGKA